MKSPICECEIPISAEETARVLGGRADDLESLEISKEYIDGHSLEHTEGHTIIYGRVLGAYDIHENNKTLANSTSFIGVFEQSVLTPGGQETVLHLSWIEKCEEHGWCLVGGTTAIEEYFESCIQEVMDELAINVVQDAGLDIEKAVRDVLSDLAGEASRGCEPYAIDPTYN